MNCDIVASLYLCRCNCLRAGHAESSSSWSGLQADVDRLQAVADQRLAEWQQGQPELAVKLWKPLDLDIIQWERKSVPFCAFIT